MTREEAIKTIRLTCPKISDSECDFETAMRFLIPELAESEDERMCTRCIELLRKVSAYSGEEYLGVEIVDCIIGLQALMKKQKKTVVDKEGIYYYLGGEFIYCGYPATEENPYDFAISQQEKQKETLHISETCKENADSFTDACKDVIVAIEKYLDWLTGYPDYAPKGKYSLRDMLHCLFILENQKAPNTRQRLAEWSKTEEGKAKYEEVAKEMRREMEKEQKPEERFAEAREKYQVEWSEEDEAHLKSIISTIEMCMKDCERAVAVLGYYESDIAWLKALRPESKDEIYKAAKHDFAIRFMNYLDENRPEGKMSLSNGECKDIDKAFKENDWTTIMKYVEKYRPSWKPSNEQMGALYDSIEWEEERAEDVDFILKSLYKDLKKLM